MKSIPTIQSAELWKNQADMMTTGLEMLRIKKIVTIEMFCMAPQMRK